MTWYFETFHEWYETHEDEPLSAVEEAFSPEAIPDKRHKPVELFLGRMQPIHLGHIKIIKKMKNPIVVLVKGARSSLDKNRNPLDADTQTKLLRKAIPGVKVIVAPNGYLPAIFVDLRESGGYEVEKVYAGADRISGYKKQVDSINKKIENEAARFEVEFVKTDRFTSATKVREVIRAGDFDAYKKLMPKKLYDEFDNLRKLIE